MDLNLAFEQVIHGLQHLEKVRLFNGEIIRYARADVESARVDANREFFDNFDDIVENDAVWAYKFQRDYNRKIKDADDIYLEIKSSEERRKKKGLPPRLVTRGANHAFAFFWMAVSRRPRQGWTFTHGDNSGHLYARQWECTKRRCELARRAIVPKCSQVGKLRKYRGNGKSVSSVS